MRSLARGDRPIVWFTFRFACLMQLGGAAWAADPSPAFFRGLNLNGPPVVIDGYAWEGSESSRYVCHDKAFENQTVALVPPTDADRARMIRSSRWGGNRIELTDVPPGTYSLMLYVWEDNDPETYSIAINGRPVLQPYSSGTQGHWERLGPWPVTSQDGKIVLTSQGGAANFSGIEVWRGQYDGLGEAISEEDLAFFEKRIRPLLATKCYACHSAEAEVLEGELLVDSRATLRRGGSRGPAVILGDVESSLLIRAVRYLDADMQMPPDERLTDEQIADLEQWVRSGAPDPRATASKHPGKRIDVEAARQFWSLRPVERPEIPLVKLADWPRSDIDRFILAQLEQQGLGPAPDADKRTLIRRATYDLTGLPPTPEQVSSFLADDSPQAFARVVDRLLASPRYGERWGRHWLDVVRYADTAGDNSDYPIPQVHLYRDWVIDALNRDLPYGEFVRDQLAGDLRGGQTEEQRVERIIATGYVASARRFGSRVDDYPWHLTIEDTIDNVGRAFLGLTLSCARCHDHKFDPITTQDYYGLYGIFSSTRYPWPGIELDKRQREFISLAPIDQQAQLAAAQAEREKRQEQLDKEVRKQRESLKKAPDADKATLQQDLAAAEGRANEHRDQPPLFRTAYAVADAEVCADAAIHRKGDPSKPGDLVRRHFPVVLGGNELPAEYSESGRRELADWILSPENPLPARVMANRVWQYHFGRGIVPTSNDFGRQGKPPTHPQLLDYLACELRDRACSLKSMHRLIMLSRVYQQAGQRSAKAIAQDPGNEFLASFPRRRLDAEALRDTLLVLGGNLDLSPPGAHPFPAQHTWDFTQHKPFKAIYDTSRRSVYLMTQRIQRHPYLAVFDGADPSTSTAARLTSTTPLQALHLMNDSFVHQQAQLVAERVLQSAGGDQRITQTYELLFSRPALPDELAAGNEFLAAATGALSERGADADEIEQQTWSAYIRALLRTNEFVYID